MSNRHGTDINSLNVPSVQLPPLVYQGYQSIRLESLEFHPSKEVPDSPTHSGTRLSESVDDSEHPRLSYFREQRLPDTPVITPSVKPPGLNASKSKSERGLWLTPLWIALSGLMVVLAVILECLIQHNHKVKGWQVQPSSENGFVHYLYTVPSSFVFMIFLAAWGAVVFEVKGAQPIVELQRGDSQAKRSIFLNYNEMNEFLGFPRSCFNKHFVVAGVTLLSILGLSFQPLAGSLVSIRETNLTLPDVTVSNRQLIGLNNDAQFQDLTTFLGASGFAAASVVYGLPEPPFIRDGYTVGNFDLPLDLAANGTLSANTTAIYNDPQCRDPDEQSMVQWPDGSGWNNTGVFSGCTFSWSVNKSSEQLFGVEPMPLNIPCPALDVTPSSEVAQVPIIFWFFTYEPSVMGSVTLCYPTIRLENVAVTVDISSANLSSVQYLGDIFAGEANFTDYVWNITDAPLNGKAYNGLAWPEAQVKRDPFVIARAAAVRLQLPAAVMEYAVQSPGGLTAAFQNNLFATLSATIYRRYLSMLARMIYFLDSNKPLNVRVETTRKRVWLSDLAGHGLAGVMGFFGFCGFVFLGLHYHRCKVETQFAEKVRRIGNPKELKHIFRDYLFSFDEEGKIVMKPDPSSSPRKPSWRKRISLSRISWLAQSTNRSGSSTERPSV